MISFIDLKAQKERIQNNVERRIKTVLDHGRFIMGPEIGELEERLADYTGSKHVTSCSSGTDALLMALMALNIGPGDAVFTTPFTFMATAEVISLLGATPIFVDIDAVTFNIDPDQLEKAIEAVHKDSSEIHPLPKHDTPLKPAAVITVDLFGLPADYGRIEPLCEAHGLPLIEDGAQSFGGSINGKKACSFGTIGTTSFFPAKPLGCYGDGGAVFTDDEEINEKLTSIRVHGKGVEKYDNIRVGLNARLDTMQAAVLLAKLDIFDDEVAARQRVASAYTEQLKDVATLTTPTVEDGYVSAWAQYSLLTSDESSRSALQADLKEAGIPTMIYYPKPLHQQTAYASLHLEESFPVSEDCSKRIFSVPMHPYLEDGTINTICQAITNFGG